MDKQLLGVQKNECIGLVEYTFGRFSDQSIPLLRRKEGQPKEYEEIGCPDELLRKFSVFREKVLKFLDEIKIKKVGQITIQENEKNPVFIPSEGRSYIHFDYDGEPQSCTRAKLMNFLVEKFCDDTDFEYIARYIIQHIEWEWMWELNRKEYEKKIRELGPTQFKKDEDGTKFIRTQFPAQALTNFLQHKKDNMS